MRATVLRPFFVERGGHIFEVGEAFDGTPTQVAKLVSRGLVAASQDAVPAAETDLSGLTVAELKSLCGERGLEFPKKATKAQLLALLGD